MKIKKHLFYILTYICFFGGMNLAFGQDAVVPDVPEDLRVLPESFKDDYQSNAYNYEESISFFTKIKQWILYKIMSWFQVEDVGANRVFENLQFIFYVLVILAVVYFIIKIILNKEGRWLFKRNKDAINDLNYDIVENIHEVNFDTLIAEAIVNKDYRLATRYYYLLLLKKLDEFNVISYDAQKTSYDYQTEMDGSKYASDFNKATYYYTYIWYGEFMIDEEEYQTTSTLYLKLLKQLGDG